MADNLRDGPKNKAKKLGKNVGEIKLRESQCFVRAYLEIKVVLYN
jgi:hypothetical protein